MVKTLVVRCEKFEYPEFLFEYLEPYLERFSKENLVPRNEEIKIPNPYLEELITLINEACRDLIKERYQEPTPKQRSKYPTRYKKVEFKDQVYIVDYRRDLTGKLIYALDYLIMWLNERKSSHAE